MRYPIRRCYGRCHAKEVRGDGWDPSHLHFIIKILMDHSRKSLQSFQLLLLDVALDILGTITDHLCLIFLPLENQRWVTYGTCSQLQGFADSSFPRH